MHCLRLLASGDANAQHPTASSLMSPSGSNMASPAKGQNTTGIYLDNIGDPLEVVMANGKRGIHGTAFRDRILPPTPVKSKSAAPGLRGLRKAAAVRQATLFLPSTVSPSTDHPLVSVGDEHDWQDSARSAGSSGVASSVANTASEAAPLKRNGSTDGKLCVSENNDEDGFTRIDRFFHRMRQDLRDLRRVDAAELSRRHMVDNGVSNNKAQGGVGMSSSSSRLNPWIRVDAKKRAATNELFFSLQQTKMADVARLDARKYLHNRERKYHQNVHLIFEPAKLLLETIWDQHLVPKSERAAFAELHFGDGGDVASYDAISRELERYHQSVSEVDVELLRQVALREAHIAELKSLLDSPPPSFVTYVDSHSSSRPSTPSTSVPSRKPSPDVNVGHDSGYALTLLNCISLIRFNTCMIVDLVQQKRGAMSIDARSATLQPSKDAVNLASNLRESRRSDASTTSALCGDSCATATNPNFQLLWEGANYIIGMQHDLDFLQHSPLQALLCPAQYRLVSNPLFLPNRLLDVCEARNTCVREHRMDVVQATQTKHILRAGPSPTPTDCTVTNRSDSRGSIGVERSSSSCSIAASQQPRIGTPTTSLRSCDLVPPPRPSTSMSSAPLPKPSLSLPQVPRTVVHKRIIVMKEGEEADTTVASNATSPSPLVGKLGATMGREAYFAQVRKEELMRTRRIPMDRSNVYKYPAAVYQSAVESPWHSLAHRLRRSLDPQVPSTSCDDATDFDRLQFGRLTVPPSQAHPYSDPIVDTTQDCLRTVLREIPVWTAEELMRRDILVFAEDAIVLKATAHQKLSKGMARFRMAYRGFVTSLNTRRKIAELSGDEQAAAREFVEWVSRYAPSWMEEVNATLLETDDDEHMRRVSQAMKHSKQAGGL